MRRGDDSERGAVAIVAAVFAVVAMLLLAFAVDRGRIYVARAQLQNAMDAAVLAATSQTCLNKNTDYIRGVAVDYANRNGVTITNADVLVQDGNYTKTGVSAKATQQVSSVFGGFAGVQTTTVAARATALRDCTELFQYVASKDFDFNGSGATVGGNFYAGECFDGGGGTFTGTIKVGSARTKSNCFHAGTSPIYNQIGNGQSATVSASCEPDAENVSNCIYSSPQTTPADAFANIADQAIIDAGLAARTGTCNTSPASTIYCDGDFTSNDAATYGNSIYATGNILIKGGTQFVSQAGWIIIYSKNGSVSVENNVSIPANVVIYAPSHLTNASGQDRDSVIYQGSGASLLGVVLGYNVNLNGGGAQGGTGISVRNPGAWTLSQ